MKKLAIAITSGLALAMSLGFGCGGSASTSTARDGGSIDAGADVDATVCEVGETRTCKTCPAGSTGTETCGSGGWGGCYCDTPDAAYDGAQVCGDGHCSGTESCETCPVDCGECAPCSLAPSCTNGASLPATLTPLSSFDCSDTDGGAPRCGVGIDAGPPIQNTDCLAPQLKISLADIRVVLNGVGGNLNMFCIVGADDGHTSELIITPQESNIPDHGPPVLLSTAQGTFWGQDTGSPMLSQFPITIDYQCFEIDSNSTWQSVLNAIANEAGMLAQVPGNPYGWVFGAAAAAAAAAEAGLQATDGNSLRFDYEQTIDPSSFLEMTNGKTWTVEQSGDTNGYHWDWALDMQSWGCSGERGTQQ